MQLADAEGTFDVNNPACGDQEGIDTGTCGSGQPTCTNQSGPATRTYGSQVNYL